MDKAKEFLLHNILDNAKVIVCVSGGPDSMCLLNLVCELRDKKNLSVVVAHVNHNLRQESKKEQQFINNFCKEHNLIFETIDLDFKDKFNEQKGHQLRYAYFKKILNKYHTKYLLMAHHGDDLIESILMRITRGSNLEGYLGFKNKNEYDDMLILRPLIYYTKNDILKYNAENKVPYVIDKSNDSNKYTRNRYRKQILPFLKEEDNNIHLKYLKFSEELENTQKFIDEYITKLEVIKENEIDINKLNKESDFIKRKVITKVIKNIQAYDWLDIDNKKMEALLNLLEGKNRQINLDNGYVGIKDYQKLVICKANNKNCFEYSLTSDIITDVWEIRFGKDDNDSNYCLRLNSKEINLPLKVRNRHDGDKMTIKNFQGHKKINDILNENKISFRKKDDFPIVTDSNDNILWIPGLKKSKFAKNKNEIYDIILKYKVR